MLNIYTDIQFLTETHRREVFPLLFDIHFLKSVKLKQHFNLIDTAEASDIVIFPIDYASFYKHKMAFNNLLAKAKSNNKPLWIYSSGDFGFTNYIPNSYTFRLGGFDSQLSDSTFIVPSFINDPYKVLKKDFLALNKEKQPSIGFVGHAKSGLSKYGKELFSYFKRKLRKGFADKQSFYPSSINRSNYLNILSKDNGLNTNFILRDNYRAGTTTGKTKEETTLEFYNNMYTNAYTFCSRGVGNFSVRFYETLAMGRIPVLLNTDCRLPLSDTIDWTKHCVIIEENEINKMAETILEFHNSKDEGQFFKFQKNNRLLWESTLVRDKYFIAIHDAFINKKKANA
ncbi:exostosin family protein [uncultured Lacinutrix sp.]|uniref:exostosin domain-containing protein n=1 Tax=uncultured Lacinutrix sp. TaxID=574032 RepID=UPI00262CF8E1|nr:exostosin family protein [uncultured Lacinutrix sp.]